MQLKLYKSNQQKTDTVIITKYSQANAMNIYLLLAALAFQPSHGKVANVSDMKRFHACVSGLKSTTNA